MEKTEEEYEEALDLLRAEVSYQKSVSSGLRADLRALEKKLEPIFRVRVGKDVYRADCFERAAYKKFWSLLDVVHSVDFEAYLDHMTDAIVLDLRVYVEKLQEPRKQTRETSYQVDLSRNCRPLDCLPPSLP